MSLGIQKDIGITMENDVAQATLKEKLDAIAFGQNPAWFNMGFLGPWGQFGSTYDQLGLIWPNLEPIWELATNLGQLELTWADFGPKCDQLGPTWVFLGQPEASLGQLTINLG